TISKRDWSSDVCSSDLPNRSARIALVEYEDGEKRYILAPTGVRVGTRLTSGPGAELAPGNALPLRNIPTDTTIHNIELRPGQGEIGRAACRGRVEMRLG